MQDLAVMLKESGVNLLQSCVARWEDCQAHSLAVAAAYSSKQASAHSSCLEEPIYRLYVAHMHMRTGR